MISLDEGEARLLAKYWGRNDLVEDEEFWQDVFDYYTFEIHDAPLPLMFDPYTVRRVLEMLKCPSGVCGKCCYYDNIQVSPSDIKRIIENTSYTDEDLAKLLTIKNDKVVLNGKPDGCPFLKDNSCMIYDFRPDCCYMFPFSGRDAMAGNVQVKQMQIRIICEPALAVVRKLITEVIEKGETLLLPDLTIIPKVEG